MESCPEPFSGPYKKAANMRRWLQSPPVVVLLFACLLGGIEAGLRLGLGYGNPRVVLPDDELGYRLQPGQKVQGPRGTIESINSKGYRDREFPAPQSEPAAFGPRIVVLGDSVSYGVGVDAAKAWPRQLEHLLRERGHPAAQVLCLSVPGYTAEQMLRAFARDAAYWKPDVVAIELTSYSIRPHRKLTEPKQFPLGNFLRRTAIWDFLRRKHWARLGGEGLRAEQAVLQNPHASEHDPRWRLLEQQLEALAQELAERGAALLIVATPRLDVAMDPTREESRWREFAQALPGVLYTSAAGDLHARIKAASDAVGGAGQAPWSAAACFLPGDSPHLDEAGHEVVALRVQSAVEEWTQKSGRVAR